MSPKQILYLAIACLILILSIQVYVLNDYFRTSRSAIARESDVILEQSFKRELTIRQKKYRKIRGEETIVAPPEFSKKNATYYETSKLSNLKANSLGVMDLVVNAEVSKSVPMNGAALDSITTSILHERNIQSDFKIMVVDLSLKDSSTNKPFALLISSKLLQIDIAQKYALQLTLINPFRPLFEQMGIVLIVSIILSAICLFAFWLLFRILAHQKQLVSFKNEFLATIAHELKRPVASLSFNLDSLKIPSIADSSVKRDQLIDRSIYSTTELNATINMIVALSKVEEGILTLNNTPINLKHLFEELKNRFMTEASKQVRIELQCDGDDLSCNGDAQLLTQCFANLIDNAIKYSDKEVLIVISLYKLGSWVVISVKDNGLGIPDEKLPVIFDKYVRVHSDDCTINGFGIGLNYVKTIVEKHQGTVEVKSVVGEGSEFSVLLPNNYLL